MLIVSEIVIVSAVRFATPHRIFFICTVLSYIPSIIGFLILHDGIEDNVVRILQREWRISHYWYMEINISSWNNATMDVRFYSSLPIYQTQKSTRNIEATFAYYISCDLYILLALIPHILHKNLSFANKTRVMIHKSIWINCLHTKAETELKLDILPNGSLYFISIKYLFLLRLQRMEFSVV